MAEPAPTLPQISRQELLRRLYDPTLTIVNALARTAWEAARIPRSVSLPVAEIPAKAAEVLPDKGADIAVYCASPT